MCPRSEVNRIAANHPPQEQIQALARAARRRSWEEITDTGAFGNAAVCGTDIGLEGTSGERFERRADVGRRGIVAIDEEALDRPGLPQHALQDEEQRDEIAPANPAVDERIDSRAMCFRIECAYERRRVRTHDREQRFDRLEDARNPPERERSRAEADDLAIIARRITADDVNRIARRGDVVEVLVQVVESSPECIGTRNSISGTA